MELLRIYSKYAPIPKLMQTKRPRTVRPVPRVHRVSKRLGPVAIAQLIADYQAGEPTTALMRKYQLGKGTVLDLLEAHGVPRRHQPMTAEQRAEAVSLYRDGWSLARIGRYFTRDPDTIRSVLKRAGVYGRR